MTSSGSSTSTASPSSSSSSSLTLLPLNLPTGWTAASAEELHSFQKVASRCFNEIRKRDTSESEAKAESCIDLEDLEKKTKTVLEEWSIPSSVDVELVCQELQLLNEKICSLQRRLQAAAAVDSAEPHSKAYAFTPRHTHLVELISQPSLTSQLSFVLKLNIYNMQESFEAIKALNTPLARINGFLALITQIKREVPSIKKKLITLTSQKAELIANHKTTKKIDADIAKKNELIDDLKGKLQGVKDYVAHSFSIEERIAATAGLQNANLENSQLFQIFLENLDPEGATLAAVLLKSKSNFKSSSLVHLLTDLLQSRHQANPSMSLSEIVTKWPQQIEQGDEVQRKQLATVSDLMDRQRKNKDKVSRYKDKANDYKDKKKNPEKDKANHYKTQAEGLVLDFLLHVFDGSSGARMAILSTDVQAGNLSYPLFYLASVNVLQSVNRLTGTYASSKLDGIPRVVEAPKAPSALIPSAEFMIQSWAVKKPKSKEIKWVASLLKYELCRIFTAATLNRDGSLKEYLTPISEETVVFLKQLETFIFNELQKIKDLQQQRQLGEVFLSLARELILNQNEALCAQSIHNMLLLFPKRANLQGKDRIFIAESEEMKSLSEFIGEPDKKNKKLTELTKLGIFCSPRLPAILAMLECQPDELIKSFNNISTLLEETCQKTSPEEIKSVLKAPFSQILDFFDQHCSSSVLKAEKRAELIGLIQSSISTKSLIAAYPESVYDQYRLLSLYYGHDTWREMPQKSDLIELMRAVPLQKSLLPGA